MKLNEEQRKAVYCDADKIVCIAGAGSGKTFSLIERVKRLVDDGADPSSILVLTFTKAAAFEMDQRYRKRMEGNTQAVPEFKTFHAFCYGLITHDRDVLKAIGYTRVPSIIRKDVEKSAKYKAIQQLGIKLSKKKLSGDEPLTPKEQYEYNVYKKAVDAEIQKQNQISFDTLFTSICDLFTNNDQSIVKYKDKYKYVIVDEFQDTDKMQWQFVQSLPFAKLFVVGDALQNLYSFRGTTADIIKGLSEDPEWVQIYLSNNYRSGEAIVDYANENTSYAKGKSYRNIMNSILPGGEVRECELMRRKPYGASLQYDEEEWLDKFIYNINRGNNPGQYAMLCKTNREVSYISDYFKRKGIEVSSSVSSTEEVEMYLQAVDDTEFLIDWTSSLLPAEKYADWIRISQSNKNSTMTTEEYYKIISSFPAVKYRVDTVIEIRRIWNDKTLSIGKRIYKVCKLVGIEHPDLNAIAEYLSDKKHSIREAILEESKKASENSIYVGTIHSVKGLEFDNVVLFGVNDSTFKLEDEDAYNLFYVGITRAKKHLIVFRYYE